MPAALKPSVQTLLRQLQGWESFTRPASHKVLRSLQRCRTAALGYDAWRCQDADCGAMHYRYHSCRNRHCPNCGNSRKDAWIEERTRELLPVKYYHAVFTLPHQLNALVMGNRRQMFNLLFRASSYTLLKFGRDARWLGATPGIITVLHTWGQQLSFHPHLHCIVSGGGVDKQGQWKEAVKTKHGVLFPVKAMGKVYRGYFLQHLQKLVSQGKLKLSDEQVARWPALISELFAGEWIVYAKQPFGGPQQVIEYLGRYTHKVAISNHRITAIDQDSTVHFEYKDYRDGGKKKQMSLGGREFLRRFEQHILPKGFMKIRSFGYLGNYNRRQRVNDLLSRMHLPVHPEHTVVPVAVRMLEKYGVDITLCPACRRSKLELLYVRRPKGRSKTVQRE